MNFKILFFTFLISLSSYISKAQTDCKDLPQSFKSYNEAVIKVTTSKFLYSDFLSGNFSSWINKARFYSCDKRNGYLILETSDTKYIHKNVPLNVWYAFKVAKSKGSYYTKYIRGRYGLKLAN